jgi:hypothetical protein
MRISDFGLMKCKLSSIRNAAGHLNQNTRGGEASRRAGANAIL